MSAKFYVIHWLGCNLIDTITDPDQFDIDVSGLPVHSHTTAQYSPDNYSANLSSFPCHIWSKCQSKSAAAKAEKELKTAINSFPWSSEKCPEYSDAYCCACQYVNSRLYVASSIQESDEEESENDEPPAKKPVKPPKKGKKGEDATLIAVIQNANTYTGDNFHDVTVSAPLLSAAEANEVEKRYGEYCETGVVPVRNDPSAMDILVQEVRNIKQYVQDQTRVMNTSLTSLDNKVTRLAKDLKEVRDMLKHGSAPAQSNLSKSVADTCNLSSEIRKSIENHNGIGDFAPVAISSFVTISPLHQAHQPSSTPSHPTASARTSLFTGNLEAEQKSLQSDISDVIDSLEFTATPPSYTGIVPESYTAEKVTDFSEHGNEVLFIRRYYVVC